MKIQCEILKQLLDMLEVNLSESDFKKQTKAGAGDKNGILKHLKVCTFSYLLEQNVLPFCLEYLFINTKLTS